MMIGKGERVAPQRESRGIALTFHMGAATDYGDYVIAAGSNELEAEA